MKKVKLLLGVMILSMFVFTGTAYAYIDPGTGSNIIQIVIAFVIAIPFIIKTSWKKIKIFFGKFSGL